MAKQDLAQELEKMQAKYSQAQADITSLEGRLNDCQEELKIAEARVRSAYADRQDIERNLESAYQELRQKDNLIARLTARYIALEEIKK